MTKLEIGKLRSTMLPTRRMRLNCLALAQGAKKALKRVNGALLKPRWGAFWEISSTETEKSSVFRGQEALSPEVSLPKWRAHRPQAKK